MKEKRRSTSTGINVAEVWRDGDPVPYNEARRDYYRAKYEIASRLQPGSILEIGVRVGYGAWAFLQAVPGARYDGFDNLDPNYPDQLANIVHARKILAPFDAEIHEVDTQVARSLGGLWDMAHIDGDHSEEGCLHDIGLAVLSGCRWIVVDDTGCFPPVARAVERAVAKWGLEAETIDEPYRGMTLLTVP